LWEGDENGADGEYDDVEQEDDPEFGKVARRKVNPVRPGVP